MILLLVLTCIGTIAVQIARGRKGAGVAEYFLASRNVGWLALALSFTLTTLWALWSLYAGLPLASGFTGWWLPVAVAAGGLLLLGLVFSSLYRASEAATFPAVLGERYGKGVRLAIAAGSIAVTILVSIPFTILVATRLLNALLGWEHMSSALLMIVVTGLFVIPRGYPAVMAVHIGGSLVAGVGVLLLAFSGFSPAEATLHRMLPEAGSLGMPLLTSVIVAGFGFTCIDQTSVQRVFAARSCKSLRSGAALAAVLVALGAGAISMGFDAAPVAGGRVFESSLAAGFVGAAIVAFGVATLSGLFMSASTVFTMDIILGERKTSDEAARVLVGRLANTVIVILAITTASSIALTGDDAVFAMASVVAVVLPPIVAILLLGFLWHRIHGRGAFWALIAGWGTGFLSAVLLADDFVGLARGGLAGLLLAALVCIGVSLASAPRTQREQAADAMVGNGLEAREP